MRLVNLKEKLSYLLLFFPFEFALIVPLLKFRIWIIFNRYLTDMTYRGWNEVLFFFFFCRERSIVSIFLNFYKFVYFPLRYFFRRRLIYDTAFHCRKILCRVSVLVRRRL